MANRINIAKTKPEAVKGLLVTANYLAHSSLSPALKELIKIRASQLNGCAYCIDMHTQDARKHGETEKRIYLLSAWKETGLYTEEERIALQLTEDITLIANGGVSDETYNKAIEVLGEEAFTQVVMAIVAINSWNRLAISGHYDLTYDVEKGTW